MTPESSQSPPPRRRRWWLRIVLALLVLLVATALLGPVLAAPYVRGKVVEALGEELTGSAAIEELRFDLGGSLRLGGLRIDEEGGAPFARLGELRAKVALPALVKGEVALDVTVTGLELHVRREPSGAWNFETIQREKEKGSSGSSGPKTEEQPGELPRVKARVALRGGRVVVHGAGGETALEDLRFDLDLTGLEERAPFTLSAAVRGPGGPGGTLELSGELTAAHDGRIGADTISGLVEASLDALALAALEPALAQAAGEAALPVVRGGLLGLRSKTSIARGPALDTTLALTVDGLELEQEGQRVALAALRLDAQAGADAHGNGSHALTLELPGMAKLELSGEASGLAGADGRVQGELDASGDLAALTELARGFAPLLPGRELAGALSAEAEWSVQLGQQSAGSVTLSSALAGLELRDADGKTLELEGLEDATLELRAAFDRAAGRADVERFELAAGPVQASAHAGVRGFAEDVPLQQLSVPQAELRLDADLDRLNAIARQLVDLGERAFGGRVSVRADARGEEGRWTLEGGAVLSELTLAGFGDGPVGPLAATLDLRGDYDPAAGPDAPAGRATLKLDSEFLQVEGEGRLARLDGGAPLAGDWRQTTRVQPGRVSELLGPLLAEFELGGERVDHTLGFQLGGEDWALTSKLEGPALSVRGPGLGEAGLSLEGLASSLEASGDRAGERLDMPALQFALARADAELPAEDDAAPMRVALAGLELESSGESGMERSTLELSLKSTALSASGGTLAAPLTVGEPALAITGLAFDRFERTLAVPLMQLTSDLVRGGGSFAVSGLDEVDPQPVFDGKLAFEGDHADLMRAVAAVAPESVQELTGGWRVELEGRAGMEAAEVRAMSLRSPGVEVTGRGSASGYIGDGALAASFTLEPRVTPGELGAWARPWMAGASLGGEPLAGSLELSVAGERAGAKGELASSRFDLTLPPEEGSPAPRTARFEQLALAIDVEHDAARDGGRLDLRQAELRTSALTAGVTGALTGTAQAGSAQAGLELALDAQLEPLVASLGAALPLPVEEPRGTLTVRSELAGPMSTLALGGEARFDALHLVLPSETDPNVKGRIDEERLTCTFASTYDTEAGALELSRLHLDGQTLRGDLSGRFLTEGSRFEDLAGELTYVPDRLDAWLRPWLPGRLSGAEPRAAKLELTGAYGGMGTLELARALRGDARIELGQYAQSGFELGGALDVKATGDVLTLGGSFGANGGQLALDTRLDLRARGTAEAPLDTHVKVTTTAMGLRPELAPLLAYAHPALGSLKQVGAGTVAGKLTSQLELRYATPLTADVLAAGWAAVKQRAVGGAGRLELSGISLAGSPMVSGIVSLLGEEATEGLALDPLKFTIREGRLGYDKPWQWTIAGAPTQFGGTIGLDGGLDLDWTVPVTESLVSRYSFLKSLQGESIRLPVEGTVQRPRLSLQASLDDLAKQALQRELEKRAGGGLPDLGDILGGGGAQGPEALLDKADELYAAGKKAEAAALYQKLRDDHKISVTYLLNKSRIESRRKEK